MPPLRAPGNHPSRFRAFRSVRGVHNFTVSGVTKDSTGATLGGCTVSLFRAGDNSIAASTVSDGSGNYSFTLGDNAGNFYVVAYKAGSPDVAGTTVNTLVAL